MIFKMYKQNKEILDRILDKKISDSKIFLVYHCNKPIGFEMAQIEYEWNGKKVGWKPWMYIQKKYRNRLYPFINNKKEIQNKQVALQLDNTVAIGLKRMMLITKKLV